MSATLQVLVRNLLAAGGAPSKNQEWTNLLHEEDGDLMEQLWTEQGLKEQRSVASNAKKDTPGLYLVGEEKVGRLIFYLDKSSAIKCVLYNDDEDEWEECNLGDAENTVVHSESQLGGCFTPNGIAIFFQNPAEQLGVIIQKDDAWKVSKLPATLSTGTPLSAIDTKDGIKLFYSHKDGSIHHQAISSDISTWKDHVLEKSKFDKATSHLLVVELGDQATSPFEIYALTGSTLVRMTMTGDMLELGKVEGKRFIPPSNAQNTYIINGGYNTFNNYNNIGWGCCRSYGRRCC